MSAETITDLNTDARTGSGTGTLIGFTEKRGNAWHYRAEVQGTETNHYAGAIPVADVIRRLFFWEPVSVPLTVVLPEIVSADGVTAAQTIVDESRQVIVRPDNGRVLGVFKESYKGHSYKEWLVENLSNLLSDTLHIGSAGVLGGGARAWVQIEAEESYVNGKTGVSFRPFILAGTSYDGTLATTYSRAFTNTVCDNTMSMALGEHGGFRHRVKHTKHSVMSLENARDALAMIESERDAIDAGITALVEQTVTDKQWSDFLAAYVPLPENGNKRGTTVAESKREALTGLWNNDDRVTDHKNTAWGVVQAVNTFDQHVAQVRNGSDVKGPARFERATAAALTGKLDQAASDVFKTLTLVTA